jgi:hypothetical protein
MSILACCRPRLPRLVAGWLPALLLLAIFIAPARLVGQTPPVTLEQYTAQLAQVVDELQRLGDPARADAAAIEQIMQPLAAVEQVELPNGELMTPAPLALPDPETGQVDWVHAAAHVQALHDQLVAAPYDDTEARLAMLVHVFEHAAFTAQESLAARIWRWIEARLREWFPDWQPAQGTISAELSTWVGWIVVGVAAIALALLASYWLQGILANLIGGSDAARRREIHDLPLDAATAQAQAQREADAGNYREAVRRLYLAALLLLDEQRLIALDRSRTNREMLAALPADSLARAHLGPVIATFDAVWYGIREPDEPTYLRYRAEIDALGRMARQTSAPSRSHEAAP